MADNCICGEDVKALGTPNCIPNFGVGAKLLLAQLVNSENVRQNIDITAIDATYFTDRVNDPEYKDRIHPTPVMENYTYDPAEDEVQTTTGGTTFTLRDGRVTITGQFMNMNPTFYGQLKSIKCPKMGFMIVDRGGNLIGDSSEAFDNDILKFVPIQKGSVQVRFFAATDATVPYVMISFQIDSTFDIANLGMIEASDIPESLLDLEDAIPAVGVASDISTTGATVAIGYLYGTGNTREPLTDAVSGDFVLKEISPTPSTITITSSVETPDGTYEFVFPTQTSGDVLELTLNKDGFALEPVRILIP